MKEDKIYVGNGKVVSFDNGGELYSVGICLTDLPKKFFREGNDGKKWINLRIAKQRANPKKLYVEVDTWMPNQSDDDIPF